MSAKKKIPDKICERCKAAPVQVEHHKLPRALGGSDKEENKEWLCRDCHSKIHVFLQYPKDKRAGKPFFKNVIATYYGKDNHVYKKAKHLEEVAKSRAQSRSATVHQENRK